MEIGCSGMALAHEAAHSRSSRNPYAVVNQHRKDFTDTASAPGAIRHQPAQWEANALCPKHQQL